jgi:uncharacterized protein (TIGR03435 family)
MRVTRTFTGVLISGLLCLAQNLDVRREFEVATIHLVKLESRIFPPTTLRRGPVRIAYNYIDLGALVRKAYDLPEYRIEWPERLLQARQELYSIAATFPEGTTDAELRGMLQRLLQDRLALRTRWANKSLAGYEMTIAPGGVKLPRSKFNPAENRDDPYDEMDHNRYSIRKGLDGSWRLTGVISTAQLSGVLGAQLGKPMIDKTGMQGYYDVDLKWDHPRPPPLAFTGEPTAAGEASLPQGSLTATLYPALEKQLGLKAAPARLIADVLMIDSVQSVPGSE